MIMAQAGLCLQPVFVLQVCKPLCCFRRPPNPPGSTPADWCARARRDTRPRCGPRWLPGVNYVGAHSGLPPHPTPGLRKGRLLGAEGIEKGAAVIAEGLAHQLQHAGDGGGAGGIRWAQMYSDHNGQLGFHGISKQPRHASWIADVQAEKGGTVALGFCEAVELQRVAVALHHQIRDASEAGVAKQDGSAVSVDQPLHAFELMAQLLGKIHRPPPRRFATVRSSVG